jgi:hypothetical protein
MRCCSLFAAPLPLLGSNMRLPVVPLYARSIGADTIQIGMINSTFFLMTAAVNLVLVVFFYLLMKEFSEKG